MTYLKIEKIDNYMITNLIWYGSKRRMETKLGRRKTQSILETYDVDAPRLTTLETFNKPINDYFKAKKAEITNPKNISLVHKYLVFLPS